MIISPARTCYCIYTQTSAIFSELSHISDLIPYFVFKQLKYSGLYLLQNIFRTQEAHVSVLDTEVLKDIASHQSFASSRLRLPFSFSCRQTCLKPRLHISFRCWACPVASWDPFPAAGPSSAHQSPCASGTGSHSSLGLSAGREWSGRRGCSEATGSCRSDAEGSLWQEGSCACDGCGCCWCAGFPGDCGPSSEGLSVGRCLSPGCPSSICRGRKTRVQTICVNI